MLNFSRTGNLMTCSRFTCASRAALSISAVAYLAGVSIAQAIAPVPFYDGFEGERLLPYWQVDTVGAGLAEIRTTDGPQHGNGHLILASQTDQVAGEAEVTIALDLEGASGLELGFGHREWDDEDNAKDGVWISDDGQAWHLIQPLVGSASTNQYTDWVIDLDAAVAGAGLVYTTPFYISLQWRDNFDLPNDGFGFDDFWVRPAASTTWHVPQDFLTIQAAIDAASDGDVVRVAPGVYTERVDFRGRAVSLVSEEGADQTTIVAGIDYSVPFPEEAAVKFVNEETRDSQLIGFTVTAMASGWTSYGVWSEGSEPWVQNCILRDSWSGGLYGGGLLLQTDVVGNGLTGGPYYGKGGGVAGSTTLVDCQVEGNRGVDGGGLGGSHVLVNCDVIDNHSWYSEGGGWNATGGIAYATRFQGNFTSDEHKGGGVSGSATLIDSLVESNSTDGQQACASGGGVNGSLLVRNCTVLSNSSWCHGVGGGGVAAAGHVVNSIVRQNVSSSAAPGYEQIDLTTATFSNVEDGYPGIGNIDVDPLLDADFFPLPGSPMLDAGDPSHPLDADGSRIDMGMRPLELQDCDGNGIPDPYEIVLGAGEDCNANGFLDSCDLAAGLDTDLDGNGALDSCVPAPLMADVYEVSVSAGGTQSFSLTTALPNQVYFLLGSGAGVAPGVSAAGLHLPLNPGPYFDFTLNHPNQAPLSGSFGVLIPSGTGLGLASATFTLPAGSNPALVGKIGHHAFVTFDILTGVFTSTSNSVPVALLP